MHLRSHDTKIHEEILAINCHFVKHKISRFRITYFDNTYRKREKNNFNIN